MKRQELIDACKVILDTCPPDLRPSATETAKRLITSADPARSGTVSEDSYYNVLEELRSHIYGSDRDSEDPEAVLAEDRTEYRKKFMSALSVAVPKMRKAEIQKLYEKFCPAIPGKNVRVQPLSLPIAVLVDFTKELEMRV